MKRAIRQFAVLFAIAAACAPAPALAQDPAGNAQGIPAYAVARLKVLNGSVWVRTEASGDWEEFDTNSPVPPGSRVSVPAESEGELQFHGGQFVLLTSGTDLEAREFREERSAFRIRAGEIRFDLTEDDFAPATVRVPGGANVQLPRPGKYWIVVDEGNQTRLVVRSGEAIVLKDEGKTHVRGGEQAVIGEVVTVSRYGQAEEQPEETAPEETGSEAPVPPSVTSELQDYGEWVTVPDYGYVWRPYVATGWSPYVYGRWVWISPYGWTWVSHEPWGWYPYRCGYWVTVPSFGWVWYPYNAFFSVSIGTPYRPYYSYGGYRYYYRNAYYYPANVRFVPEGGRVRWVPLRPGERYRPAGVRRGDPTLARWNRPLESGRVYVRTGTDRRQTRDYTAVRAEQQARTRQTLEQPPRKDTRTVRPERKKDGRAAQQQPQRRTSQPAYSGTGQRPAGRSGVAPPAADGKSKSPSGNTFIPPGGTHIPRDAAPERGRVDRERRPTGAASATPPSDGKAKSPTGWRYIPRDAAPEGGRVDKERRPPGAASATPPSDGKAKSPTGWRYIPRDAAPESGRVDKERRPPGAASATPPSDGKAKSPTGWRYIPRDTAPEIGRFEKESHPPGAAPVPPPAAGKPQGQTRGRVPAQKSPAVVPPRVREYVEHPPAQPSPIVRESAPPPALRQETPAVVPDAAGEVRGGDGGSRGGSGGVRGGDGGSGGGGRRGSDGGSRGGGRTR